MGADPRVGVTLAPASSGARRGTGCSPPKRRAALPKWVAHLAWCAIACFAAGCGTDTAPPVTDAAVRAAIAASEVTPLEPLPEVAPAMYALGQALFFDPELSGNRDIACATCHAPALGTSDFISMAIGTGGRGVGPNRVLPEARRLVPRNTLELFNRGYPGWDELGWDGRIRPRGDGGWTEPEDWEDTIMPDGLDSALAAQALDALSDRDQMAGRRGDLDVDGNENEIGGLEDEELPELWRRLVVRVLALEGYQTLVAAAYPDVATAEVDITHLANALAAFQGAAFVATDTDFDRYLAGDDAALSAAERSGAALFFGAAECATCHSGPHLTDFGYRNLAVPQVGLGQEDEEPMDYGRGRETNVPGERFLFRTPALRNVTETGPWMHDGAYTTLEGAVRHHLNCEDSLRGYDPTQLKPELQSTFRDAPIQLQRILASLDPWCVGGPSLSDAEVADLLAFLGTLRGPSATDVSMTPASVPSGRSPR